MLAEVTPPCAGSDVMYTFSAFCATRTFRYNKPHICFCFSVTEKTEQNIFDDGKWRTESVSAVLSPGDVMTPRHSFQTGPDP